MVKAPPTFIAGTHKIDVIWVSNTIPIVRCGYLPVEEMIADHRILWVDIPTIALRGNRGFIPVPLRKLAMDIPKAKEKYKKNLWQRVRQRGLQQTIDTLYQQLC